MKKFTTRQNLKLNQSGMAAFLITMIFTIVISLIVLGFAQIARQEQRASLDRQLSTQAFYAAESGVNDVQAAIQNALKLNASDTIPAKTSCTTDPDPVPGNNPTDIYAGYINPPLTSNTSYTCLLINPTPNSLVYNPISTDQSKVIRVESGSGRALDQVTISWQDSTMPQTTPTFTCSSSATNFPPAVSSSTAIWSPSCGAPVLRLDIVPADVASGSNGWSDQLDTANMITLFLHPESSNSSLGTTIGYSPASQQGSIVQANCNTNIKGLSMPNGCNVVVTGMDRSAYYMRVQSIYSSAALDINAEAVGTSSETPLINDQVVVDSTGKAQDVLRRIQVRLPINPLDNSSFPDNALQSVNSICKQFFIDGYGNKSDYKPASCSSN